MNQLPILHHQVQYAGRSAGLEIGGGVSGVGEDALHRCPADSQPPIQLQTEHGVGELRLGIERQPGILALAGEVREVDGSRLVCDGADGHHSRVTPGPQPVQ